MALTEPIAAYSTHNTAEAVLLVNLLRDAGIPATTEAVEGQIPEGDAPQVWVEKADAERVRLFLVDYARKAAEKAEAEKQRQPVTMTCEECGEVLTFRPDQVGTVQQCLICHAYMDVGESETFADEWAEGGEAEDEE
jgi:hypothetical protein